MPIVRRTARAEDDLVDLWLYVAQDDAQVADRLLEALDHRCILLPENPRLGRARPDIAPDLHYFPVGNDLILYRLLPDGIEGVRVHGARRLDSLM